MKWPSLALVVILLTPAAAGAGYSPRSAVRQPQSQDPGPITEVTLRRTWGRCVGCDEYEVIIRREAADPLGDAAVAYTALRTRETRRGKLRAYYYNELVRLIEEIGYFSLKESYGESVMDALGAETSAVRGGTRKTVLNQAGRGPVTLWGMEMAIDGVMGQVRWEDK